MDAAHKIWSWLTDPSISAAVSTITGVLGVLLCAIGVWQFRKSDRLQHKIAEAGGSFRRPDLRLHFCGVGHVRRYIFAVPLKKNAVLEVPVFYTIENIGTCTSKEIELYIESSKDLRFGGHATVSVAESKWRELKPSKVAMLASGRHKQLLVWTFESLHPGQRMRIWDTLTIPGETRGRMKVPVTTRDHKRMTASVSYEFEYTFLMKLHQEDEKPLVLDCSIAVVDTTTRTLLEHFNELNREMAKVTTEAPTLFERIKQRATSKTRFDYRVAVVELVAALTRKRKGIPFHKTQAGKLQIRDALRFPDGYLVPTLNVWPHKLQRVRLRHRGRAQDHEPPENGAGEEVRQ